MLMTFADIFDLKVAEGRLEGMTEGKAEGWLKGKAEGRLKGKAEGRLKGKAEGRLKGKAEGRLKGKAEGRLKGKAEGRLKGKAEGRLKGKAEGRLELMHLFVSERFGDDVARDAFPALSGMVEPADLIVANGLLYECPSGNEFLERLARLGRANGSAD